MGDRLGCGPVHGDPAAAADDHYLLLFLVALNYNLNYTASRTCASFLSSRERHKILAGPVGGGKTSACIMGVMLNSINQEPDNDGVRRTRHLVIRNTVPMLKTTTIKSFLDWIPDGVFGRWHSSDKLYYMKFEDVESEIQFISLEDANDIRKLLSLETTTAFFNELREIDPDVIEGLIGTKRVGRYPSMKDGPGATYPCIFADTNMPAHGTWHQQIMDGELGDWVLFKQPSGRSPEAENLPYLPDGYYDTKGLSDEYIKTMVDVEYGTSREGMPVFRSTFIPSFHIAPEPLLHSTSDAYPLIVGVDAGLTPAAIIGQSTPSGRVHILAECYTDSTNTMGMERFADTKLLPLLRGRFAGCPVRLVIDPAAKTRSQSNEETVFEILRKKYLKTITASTNKTDLRISSAELMFAKQIDGKAGMLIDKGCTGLISALKHGYKFAAKRDGEMEEKPKKDHPWSDIADAFMYFTGYLAGESRTAGQGGARAVETRSANGWT